MKRPWQLCDTSSSQDKTSRWRCDAMVTRVSHQLRRPSGFQSFTWAHSSILYTCTPVQYTLYNTHVLHCTRTPCSCHSRLIFWLRKSNEINLSRHHWKCFFLPWQQASFRWLCWFSNVNVSIRLLQYYNSLTYLFDIFILWIKIDISIDRPKAHAATCRIIRNKPFMLIVLLSTLSLESQM